MSLSAVHGLFHPCILSNNIIIATLLLVDDLYPSDNCDRPFLSTHKRPLALVYPMIIPLPWSLVASSRKYVMIVCQLAWPSMARSWSSYLDVLWPGAVQGVPPGSEWEDKACADKP